MNEEHKASTPAAQAVESQAPVETVVKKSSSKRTIVIILLVLLVVMLACCGLGGGGFYLGMRAVLDEAKEINGTTLTQLCENTSPSDYSDYFSDDFLDRYTLAEVDELVSEAYSGVDECDSLKVDGIVDLFSSGHTVEVVAVNGETTATYSFPNGDNTVVTFSLVKDGDSWLIDGVSFADSY